MTPSPLSDREHQILTLISKGYENNAIAERLHIASATVRTHVDRLRKKLGASTRAEAVARAYDLGLLP